MASRQKAAGLGHRRGGRGAFSVDMLCDLACFVLTGIAACYFLNYFIRQIIYGGPQTSSKFPDDSLPIYD